MVARLARGALIEALEATGGPISTSESLSPETRSRRADHFITDMRDVVARFDVGPSDLRRIALNDDHQLSVRFAALYGALHLLRRQGDIPRYQELVTEAQPTLDRLPLFETFYTFFHQFDGDLDTALTHAGRALEALPNTPGVQHLHAQIVADLLDRSEAVDPQIVSAALGRLEDMIQSGRAGRSPAFRETMARLLLHTDANDRHERARRAIKAALSLESSTEPGHQLRVANRRTILALIDHDQRHTRNLRDQADLLDEMRSTQATLRDRHERALEDMAEMRSEMAELRGHVDRVRDQTLTLLALFAALIAFVVSTIQVSVTLDAVSVMTVTVLLALLTIVIFSSAAVTLGLSTRRTGVIMLTSVSASILLLVLAVGGVVP